MRINPQPSDNELKAIYGKNYFLYSGENNSLGHMAELKSATADRYLNLLADYTGCALTGTLLEIGCGQGDFLKKAASIGLSVTGIEYSLHAAEAARQKVAPFGTVICGEVSQLLESGEQFDYIVFADVLEHVRNPRDFLRIVHSLLRKEGIILCVVPSLDSFSSKLLKKRWVEFKAEHLWYFSTSTLMRLLYSENFAQINTQPAKKTLSFDYIAQHFIYYPNQPFLAVIKLLKKFLPDKIQQYPFNIVASGIVMFARKEDIRSTKKLSVLMAAYNEEKTIRKTIERVLKKQIDNISIELIIIESNSTDNTQNIIREYEKHERVKIIWQKSARGKGYAIRAGLKCITGDYILIQDADDEYDVEDYDALLLPLLSGQARFVLGARHGGRAWKMRHFSNQILLGHILNFGHWCFKFLINILYGLHLKDPFTMYKVFRVDCLTGIEFECDRFDFDYELLIKLVKNGCLPLEVPVNYRSRTFSEGKKIRIFRDPWTWLKVIIRLRF